MTVFEDLNSKNIDEFAEWFEENCLHNDDPCIRWWDETCCKNCEPVVKDGQEYSYCELNGKCRYFENMDKMPNNKETIKLWLESEYNKEESKCLPILDDYFYKMDI